MKKQKRIVMKLKRMMMMILMKMMKKKKMTLPKAGVKITKMFCLSLISVLRSEKSDEM